MRGLAIGEIWVRNLGKKLQEIVAERAGEHSRPAVIVNLARQVHWANAAAVRLLQAPLALYINEDCLCLGDRRSATGFDDALARVGSAPEKIPVGSRTGKVSMIATASSHVIEGEQFFLLVIKIVDAPLHAAPGDMARFFSLTPAEAQVLDRLGTLEPPAAIAKRLGVSVHTVRTHVRNLYSKTAVHSDLELLRLALAFEG